MKNKMDAEPLLDNDVFQELQKNLPGDKLKKFLELVEDNVNDAIKTLQDHNESAFRQNCHKIKSSAAYIGGQRLHALCMEIERKYKSNPGMSLEEVQDYFIECSNETMSAVHDRAAG